MSAMLALGLLHYGFLALQPAHSHAEPVPAAAGFVILVQAKQAHNNDTNGRHTGGSMHAHAASPFVMPSVSAANIAHAAPSVAYLRLRAMHVETRSDAPPLRPPRLNL